MNEKFINAKTGEEVVVGKPFKITFKDGSLYHHIYEDPLTKGTFDYLRRIGMVKSSLDYYKETGKVSTSILDYVDKLAKKIGLSYVECCRFISQLGEYSPMTVISLLSKQISLELDKRYDGHIRDSKHIYTIDTVTGNIVEMPDEIKKCAHFRNFTAFRSRKDAEFAISLLSGYYNLAFKHDSEQKDTKC